MSVELLGRFPLRDAASRHLAENPEGSPLYPAGSLASAAAVEKRIQALASQPHDRVALRNWLAEQNAFAPLHPAQQRALDSVSQSGSLFVLTGQQPGLLGGPALWFYKAMSCVSWARTWSERLKRPVIPVFWVAGDDSDLAECNAVEWLEPDGGVSRFSFDFSDASAAVPMSLRMLPEAGVRDLLEIAEAKWGREISGWVASAYQPGRSITQAFLHLAQRILGPEGVLFVDGFAAASLTGPLLRRVVREASAFHTAVGKGSHRFAQILSLAPQVPLRHGAIPVFALEKEQRTRLFFPDSGGRVYAQGNEGRDMLPDLDDLHLLHSALTRPLVVEEIFPLLGHVLGPAELRYFAQLADVFPAFGKSFPLLAPRQQLLACAKPDWERLAALGVNPEDAPAFGPSHLRALLSERAWKNHPAAKAFPDGAFQEFARFLKEYQDKSLPGPGALDSGLRRMERAFGRYRDAAKQAVFSREASEVYASFLPLLRWLGNGSQDRHINLLSLRNILGGDGFGELTNLLRNVDASTSMAVY